MSKHIVQQWLQPGAIVPVDIETVRILMDALRTALAEPGNDYERGFVDGMSHQAKSSVDRAVNAMARKPLTNAEIGSIEMGLRKYVDGDRYDLSLSDFARAIERAHGIGGEA